MSGSSLVVLSVVLFAFAGDLLPDASMVEEIASDLRQAPAYAYDQIHPDLVSLYRDCQAVEHGASEAPTLARSYWGRIHSEARRLGIEARIDAHKIAERFSSSPQTR